MSDPCVSNSSHLCRGFATWRQWRCSRCLKQQFTSTTKKILQHHSNSKTKFQVLWEMHNIILVLNHRKTNEVVIILTTRRTTFRNVTYQVSFLVTTWGTTVGSCGFLSSISEIASRLGAQKGTRHTLKLGNCNTLPNHFRHRATSYYK